MTWARLDDGITDRPDLLALPRGIRLVHLEALVWACRHETDGDIPRHVLRKVTDEPDPEAAAAALVDAGLWDERDGGWEIVGFLDDQISADDLEKQRELSRQRQRKQRQHKAGDHSLCDPRYCRRAAEQQDASRVTNGVSNGVSHDTPSSPVHPDRKGGMDEGQAGRSRGSASATPRRAPVEPTPFTVVDKTGAGTAKICENCGAVGHIRCDRKVAR